MPFLESVLFLTKDQMYWALTSSYKSYLFFAVSNFAALLGLVYIQLFKDVIKFAKFFEYGRAQLQYAYQHQQHWVVKMG